MTSTIHVYCDVCCWRTSRQYTMHRHGYPTAWAMARRLWKSLALSAYLMFLHSGATDMTFRSHTRVFHGRECVPEEGTEYNGVSEAALHDFANFVEQVVGNASTMAMQDMSESNGHVTVRWSKRFSNLMYHCPHRCHSALHLAIVKNLRMLPTR